MRRRVHMWVNELGVQPTRRQQSSGPAAMCVCAADGESWTRLPLLPPCLRPCCWFLLRVYIAMLAPRHLHTTHTAQNSNWLLACRKPKTHALQIIQNIYHWQCEFSLDENDFTSFPIHRGVEVSRSNHNHKNSGMLSYPSKFFHCYSNIELLYSTRHVKS